MSKPESGWQGKGISKTDGICGGEACIRSTRIMVWLLISMKKQGFSDEEILRGYPSLTVDDLRDAEKYFEEHQDEIEREIREQNEY